MTAAAAQDIGPARVHPVRLYDDTVDLIEREHRSRSEYLRDMADAGLDRARCNRCLRLVKVQYGDLTGRPFAAWVAEAGKTVTRQHKDGHHPITVGRKAAPVPPRPAPGSAVFLEPGGSPAIAAVPDRKRRQR